MVSPTTTAGHGSWTLPSVELVLHDLEMEERASRPKWLDAPFTGLVGFEFRFDVFNGAGKKVGHGKIDLPGRQISVRYIETLDAFRRQRYATSAVLALGQRFKGLPVVPVSERGQGMAFWAALRQQHATARLVGEEISIMTGDLLMEQAYAAERARLGENWSLGA